MLDAATLRELENACEVAVDYAGAFRDACKAQAEQHQLEPAALSRYVKARVADKLDKLAREQDTTRQLRMQFESISDDLRFVSARVVDPAA